MESEKWLDFKMTVKCFPVEKQVTKNKVQNLMDYASKSMGAASASIFLIFMLC